MGAAAPHCALSSLRYLSVRSLSISALNAQSITEVPMRYNAEFVTRTRTARRSIHALHSKGPEIWPVFALKQKPLVPLAGKRTNEERQAILLSGRPLPLFRTARCSFCRRVFARRGLQARVTDGGGNQLHSQQCFSRKEVTEEHGTIFSSPASCDLWRPGRVRARRGSGPGFLRAPSNLRSDAALFDQADQP